MLQAMPVRDIAVERLLTALRTALLDTAAQGQTASDSELAFALAKQCLINEYIFATTPAEDAQVEHLVMALRMALATNAIPSFWLPAIAMYRP